MLNAADYQRRRSWMLQGSFVLLLLVPFVTWILASAASSMAFGYYDAWGSWTIYSVFGQAIYQLHDAAMTVCLLQILVWWMWRERHRPLGWIGIGLLGTNACVGIVLQWLPASYEWYNRDFSSRILLAVVSEIISVAIHVIGFAAFAAWISFRFLDVTDHPEDERDVPAVPRDRWSIRGIFIATLLAAVLLTSLQWMRSVYLKMGTEWYPDSDAGIAIWYVTAVTANMCCLYAAGLRETGATAATTLRLLLTAVVVTMGGLAAWVFFLPADADVNVVPQSVLSVSDVGWMYVFHRLALRQWTRCGYRLRRSRSPLAG